MRGTLQHLPGPTALLLFRLALYRPARHQAQDSPSNDAGEKMVSIVNPLQRYQGCKNIKRHAQTPPSAPAQHRGQRKGIGKMTGKKGKFPAVRPLTSNPHLQRNQHGIGQYQGPQQLGRHCLQGRTARQPDQAPRVVASPQAPEPYNPASSRGPSNTAFSPILPLTSPSHWCASPTTPQRHQTQIGRCKQSLKVLA